MRARQRRLAYSLYRRNEFAMLRVFRRSPPTPAVAGQKGTRRPPRAWARRSRHAARGRRPPAWSSLGAGTAARSAVRARHQRRPVRRSGDPGPALAHRACLAAGEHIRIAEHLAEAQRAVLYEKAPAVAQSPGGAAERHAPAHPTVPGIGGPGESVFADCTDEATRPRQRCALTRPPREAIKAAPPLRCAAPSRRLVPPALRATLATASGAGRSARPRTGDDALAHLLGAFPGQAPVRKKKAPGCPGTKPWR